MDFDLLSELYDTQSSSLAEGGELRRDVAGERIGPRTLPRSLGGLAGPPVHPGAAVDGGVREFAGLQPSVVERTCLAIVKMVMRSRTPSLVPRLEQHLGVAVDMCEEKSVGEKHAYQLQLAALFSDVCMKVADAQTPHKRRKRKKPSKDGNAVDAVRESQPQATPTAPGTHSPDAPRVLQPLSQSAFQRGPSPARATLPPAARPRPHPSPAEQRDDLDDILRHVCDEYHAVHASHASHLRGGAMASSPPPPQLRLSPRPAPTTLRGPERRATQTAARFQARVASDTELTWPPVRATVVSGRDANGALNAPRPVAEPARLRPLPQRQPAATPASDAHAAPGQTSQRRDQDGWRAPPQATFPGAGSGHREAFGRSQLVCDSDIGASFDLENNPFHAASPSSPLLSPAFAFDRRHSHSDHQAEPQQPRQATTPPWWEAASETPQPADAADPSQFVWDTPDDTPAEAFGGSLCGSQVIPDTYAGCESFPQPLSPRAAVMSYSTLMPRAPHGCSAAGGPGSWRGASRRDAGASGVSPLLGPAWPLREPLKPVCPGKSGNERPTAGAAHATRLGPSLSKPSGQPPVVEGRAVAWPAPQSGVANAPVEGVEDREFAEVVMSFIG